MTYTDALLTVTLIAFTGACQSRAVLQQVDGQTQCNTAATQHRAAYSCAARAT